MSAVRLLCLLILPVLMMTGCTKCLPRPEAVAVVAQEQQLPFRLSGITFRIDAPEARGEKGVRIDSRFFGRVIKITEEAFFKSAVHNGDALPVLSMVVYYREIHPGGASMWGITPVRYAARYDLVDPETGDVVLSKAYSREKTFERESDYTCFPFPNALKAFDQCVNEINAELINEMYALDQLPVHSAEGRIDGTLRMVKTRIPFTVENARWIFAHSEPYELNIPYTKMAAFQIDIPYLVNQGLRDEKLFNHSLEHEYEIQIVIPEIRTLGDGGFFSDPRNEFVADAVIYRDGVECGNVEFDPDKDSTTQTLVEVINTYSAKIVEAIKAMQKEEAR